MWTYDVDADDGVAAWFDRPFSIKEDLMLEGVGEPVTPPAIFSFPEDVDAGDEESDLVYLPGDSIAFPDDAPGGPFARQQGRPSGNNTMKSPVPVVAASPVVDKVTGNFLYYKVHEKVRTWSKPNSVDFGATSGAAATKTKKVVPPNKLPVVEESKVNSYEADDEEEKRADAIVGTPIIIISNNTAGAGAGASTSADDDVSATSSLSASNAGWYQYQSAVHEKQLRNAVPSKQSPVGVIFVQGSCSERINGIYAYTGMFDFVGIYTKVESYGDCKIYFRIYRRLDETMNRSWYLSIGPACSAARSDHDIDLYSAPCQVSGPAVCFVDEQPPKNKWQPIAGTGLEGTRGPLCLWIPKSSSGVKDMNERDEGARSGFAPGRVVATGAPVGADKETATKAVQEPPPRQIIVEKKAKKQSSPALVSVPTASQTKSDNNVFRTCDTEKPRPVILPSKSTETEVTVATSTLEEGVELTLERIRSTSEDTPSTRKSGTATSTNTSRSSSFSDLGEKNQPGADVVEYNIYELLDFPHTGGESIPTTGTGITSIGGSDVPSSDHEWSDLSDGEEDGIEAHEDGLIRQWTERIAQAEKKKHKVVQWPDDGTTETNVNSQIGGLPLEPNDEDFQFYARTKAGKQSIIGENIGAALFRRFRHSPRSCRCAACKKEALEAYVERNNTSHNTLFEI